MAIIHLNFASKALFMNTDVHIVIPELRDDHTPDRDTPWNARYQVLYLLHGAYGDYSDWCRKTSIERYVQERCLMVVMPSCGNSFYQDISGGPQYLTYLLDELPAYLKRMFPVSGTREDTFIAGLSMGGYGALHIAMKRPGQYAAAASLSGIFSLGSLLGRDDRPGSAPWPFGAAVGDSTAEELDTGEKNVLVRISNLQKAGRPIPAIFLTVGSGDFTLADNREGYRRLREMSVPVTYEEHPGAHDWKYWDEHIQRVLDWMLLKRAVV